MYVLVPADVTDAVLTASSLAETDYAAWSSGSAYAAGDRVILTTTTLPKSSAETWSVGSKVYWNAALARATTTIIGSAFIGRVATLAGPGTTTGSVAVHAVYEATGVAGAGVNPASDVFATSPVWTRVGSTNKWAAFNESVTQQATATGSLSYTLTAPSLCTGLALLNLEAEAISVVVKDGGVTVWSYSTGSGVVNVIDSWLEYFSYTPSNSVDEDQDSEVLLTGFAAAVGYTIEITLTGSRVRVGEIALGYVTQLGATLAGTEIGFNSYSRKDRDDWGNAILVPRVYSDTVTFRFAVAPVTDMRRVKRVIAQLESRPAVWFAGASITDRAATVYGFVTAGLRVPLEAAGAHIASLEIEGL